MVNSVKLAVKGAFPVFLIVSALAFVTVLLTAALPTLIVDPEAGDGERGVVDF